MGVPAPGHNAGLVPRASSGGQTGDHSATSCPCQLDWKAGHPQGPWRPLPGVRGATAPGLEDWAGDHPPLYSPWQAGQVLLSHLWQLLPVLASQGSEARLSAELPDGEGCKGPSPHSRGLPLPQQELCLPKPPEMSPRAQGSPGVCRRQGAEPSHTDRFPSGVCKPPWLVAPSTPGWGRGFFPSGPRGVFQAHKPTKLCPPRPPRLRQHLSGCGHRRWRRGLCGELRGGAGGRPALTSVCARTPLQRRALGPLRLRRAGRRLGRATQLL